MNQKNTFVLSTLALAASAAMAQQAAPATSAPAAPAAAASAADATLQPVVVTAKRANRVSTGATGLNLELKETPQSISVIDSQTIEDFGFTGSNDALWLGTGINVEQYETNRAVYNMRGFPVQNTQIDGLGVINSWGTVVGQMDTYLFDRIEIIRGANGLLTGVGNASGTINYVRKRPTNTNGGEVVGSIGSWENYRTAVDYNRVFTEDGSWAGRLIAVYEDKDSYLRALNNKNATLYGVIDGQIGDNGTLTLGYTHQDKKQDSPMWGSLTLNYLDGTMADFDVSSSTSQDWTMWDTKSDTIFAEYTHRLGNNWEAKASYNYTQADEETKLFYAATAGALLSIPALAGLNPDNTGLYGWPYASTTTTKNHVFDVNLSGRFGAFGREHDLIVGVNYSQQKTDTNAKTDPTFSWLTPPALPAFPYPGNIYPEPNWIPDSLSNGEQKVTRLYGATRLSLTDGLKGVVGLNAVKLARAGSSRYGAITTPTDYPDTEEVSPYAGLTYDFTPGITGYVSYSNIYQNQDQYDFNGRYLDPTEGVNTEAGVKAEWLDRKLLTTLAIFSAKQEGMGVQADGNSTVTGRAYYTPVDYESKGIEFEATGRVAEGARLTFGVTHLRIDGAEGNDFEWIPRTTVNLSFDTRLPALPRAKIGAAARWQSDTSKKGGASQDSYFVANFFGAYELTNRATLRLNINNLFNEKYINGIQYGAIYGAPTNAQLTFSYAL